MIGTTYLCEVCGTENRNPNRWFVIHCGETSLTVLKWDASEADKPNALHTCGEAHAQVYISRWFESYCAAASRAIPG